MAAKKPTIHDAAAHLFLSLDNYAQLKQLKNGDLTFNGNILPDVQRNSIIVSAKTILDLDFWEIFMKDMKQVACRKMYEEGTTPEDLAGGKWMLYTLDVMHNKLYNLSKLEKKVTKTGPATPPNTT